MRYPRVSVHPCPLPAQSFVLLNANPEPGHHFAWDFPRTAAPLLAPLLTGLSPLGAGGCALRPFLWEERKKQKRRAPPHSPLSLAPCGSPRRAATKPAPAPAAEI